MNSEQRSIGGAVLHDGLARPAPGTGSDTVPQSEKIVPIEFNVRPHADPCPAFGRRMNHPGSHNPERRPVHRRQPKTGIV